MDANKQDGMTKKIMKIEKLTEKYSRETVLNSTWRPARWIKRVQKTCSSQENISDITNIFGCGVHCCIFSSS